MTPAITHAEASANILAACEAGTLVQGEWHGRGADGREIACLLGSIHPSVKRSADCNGDLMPTWLAGMVPALFDGLPIDAIYPIARRFGGLVARWHVLSDAQWDAILTRVLIRCVDDAVDAARPVAEGKEYWPAVAAACDQVRAALSGAGDIVAAGAAARAAEAAARAARAAGAAARAAARAAEAAAEAAGAAGAAAEAAAWAAYQSLFNFVLDQIGAELEAAQ